ncbi:uncharacterized protein LOC124154558 [Ischnura elegans]|uniref:uncharacterized protein LOC124154558 n=1 Tax=Ischnura elegans TaxID=197161 RepID=UPI001ED87EDC|nr:uncharacterized protein LOC124154558 [Ischnura elegans]
MSRNHHDVSPGPDDCDVLNDFFKQYREYRSKAYELERRPTSKLLKHFCTIESTNKTLDFCLEIDGVVRDIKIVLKGFQSAQDMYDTKIAKILPSLDCVTTFRAQEAYLSISKLRTSLCFLLHKFITGALSANQVSEPILLLAQLHDSVLHQTLCGNVSKASDLCSNTCPILLRPLKRLSMARTLSVVARGRGEVSTQKLVAALLRAYSKEFKLRSEASSEEGTCSDGSHATSIEICRDLTRNVTPPLPPVATSDNYGKPYSQLFPNYQIPAPSLNTNYVMEQQMMENSLVENILKRYLRTESGDIKMSINGDTCNYSLEEMKGAMNGETISKAVEYFQQNLWREVGSNIDSAMLWWMDGRKEVNLLLEVDQVLSQGSEDLPLAFHSPETCLRLRDWLQELAARNDTLPGVMAASIQSLCDGLSSHVMAVAWDHSFRMALVQPVNLQDDGPSGAEKGTYTGRLFVEVIRRLVSLTNDWEDRGTLEATEIKSSSSTQKDADRYRKEGVYSFSADQIPVLHRLDHSLHTLRIWVQAYTRKAASSWNALCFFRAAHSDVMCALDVLKQLRLPESQDLSEVKSVNLTVCVKMRAKLVSEVKANIAKLQALPAECLTVLAMMGRTVSLATLCLIMPEARYWRRRNNALPEFPSPYVEEYLDKVLKPIIKAVQNLDLAIQQSAAGMVLRILGESWLDHIYQHRIKFSEWGALQLLTDFGSVHSWLEERITLSPELYRHLAQTEVLRRCEGVGRLLLRHPGEAISMVPPSRRTSHYHSGNANGGDGSPASTSAALGPLMPAEMYVPNQEQWLELRASGTRDYCRDWCCPCWPPLFCALCLMSCR